MNSLSMLLVYPESVDFGGAIIQHAEGLSHAYAFLVDPLNRAALSLTANIAKEKGRLEEIAAAPP